EVMAEDIERFVKRCGNQEKSWEEISKNGVRRVLEKFTWRQYSERLMHLTKLYGFWRYAAAEEGMVKMDRYCDLLYHLMLRNRAEALY
ncbi:MAG: sucrose synthase, partial [Desulfococcaceae bacterium]